MSETWLDDDFTADELAFDEELRERLRASLDVVGPTEEAEGRMLANLLAAQEARVAEEPRGAAAVEPIELPEVAVIEGGKRKDTARRRRGLLLLAAASLAALVIGMNVLSSMRMGMIGELAVPSFDVSSADLGENKVEEVSEEAMPEEKVVESSAADAATIREPDADEGAAGGASATDEAAPEEAVPDEPFAMGGAFDVTGDPSYELAVSFPEVRLTTGEVLRIEEHHGEPVIIEEKWVEQLVGEAEAFTEDGSESVCCWVYRLPVSDDGLYVVRYVENGSSFAIRVVA